MKVNRKWMLLLVCSILGLSACGTSPVPVLDQAHVSKQNGIPYKPCPSC